MLFDADQLTLLQHCQALLAQGFSHLPPVESEPLSPEFREVLERTAHRLRENSPYHHPFYLGQMLRPPHPVAALAASLTMAINPNNHALDGGRATSAMELEAVAQLAEMFGWQTPSDSRRSCFSHTPELPDRVNDSGDDLTEPAMLGHLCSGGTMANFEALWIARETASRPGVAASAQAHYTHERLSRVLQVPFFEIPCDERGKMRIPELERMLNEHAIGTVVATLGTTGLGAVDPLDKIVELQRRIPFRLHVDAAYGGYFSLAANLPPTTTSAFRTISSADSIVVDPHKHGLQPYGCGCVLFRDRRVATIYQHQSPYTYFTSDDLHLGEISLECSRAGAAAAALWATLQLFPLTTGGTFARDLEKCRDAAMMLADWIVQQPQFQLVTSPELDLVVWQIRARTSSESSALARDFFERAARKELHLALLTLPRELVESTQAVSVWDSETIVCLRACLMKPEHLDWMPELTRQLGSVLKELAR